MFFFCNNDPKKLKDMTNVFLIISLYSPMRVIDINRLNEFDEYTRRSARILFHTRHA